MVYEMKLWHVIVYDTVNPTAQIFNYKSQVLNLLLTLFGSEARSAFFCRVEGLL